MKKRIFSLIMCLMMMAAVLSACGSGNDNSGNTETNPPETQPQQDDTAEPDDGGSDDTDDANAADNGDMFIYLVSKGFQHQFWQAVYQGAQEAADELGVKMEMVGPNTESDIQDQVQMLNNAVNLAPDAIGLAALSTSACLEAIEAAMNQNIPIIGFDSGVEGAPEGAIYANASTDNYKAGELAAENTYPAIKDRIANADSAVRIGVMSQDATSESIINRGSGFIDKIKAMIEADGKTVSIEGHDYWMDKVDGADVIIDIAVPAAVTSEASVIDGQNLLNKADLIAIYGSNQHSGEALVNANNNLQKLGTGDGQIIGVAFDSGTLIKDAVRNGTLIGAVTQDPLSIGRMTVELAVAAAKGETVADVDTGCQWYTSENMDDPAIAPNLYD